MTRFFMPPACAAALLISGQALAQDPQSFEAQPNRTGPISVAAADEATAAAVTLAQPERIAGVRTYSEEMSSYPNTSFTRAGASVGRLTAESPGEIITSGPRNAYCTAWLVDRARILTARHCVEGPVGAEPNGDMRVEFGYGWSRRPGRDYRLGSIVAADDVLDFALIDLAVLPGQPQPGDVHGIIRLAATEPTERPLFVVHHPFGWRQLLLKDNTCRRRDIVEAEGWQFFHRCDTRQASSGAPIMIYSLGRTPGASSSDEPVAVALHTAGLELTTEDSVNLATSTSAIVAAVPSLRSIACTPGAGYWICPSVFPTDHRVTITFASKEVFVPIQPGGNKFVLPLHQEAFDTLWSVLQRSSGPVRFRILGDATLDEPMSSISGPLREFWRRQMAYMRAYNVASILAGGWQGIAEIEVGIRTDAGAGGTSDVIIQLEPAPQ